MEWYLAGGFAVAMLLWSGIFDSKVASIWTTGQEASSST
jgi:hypothetical protein